MPARLRRIGLVSVFDFSEAIRSRKAVVVLLLYMAGASIGTWVFLNSLSVAESLVRERLGSRADGARSVAEALLRSEEFLNVVARLIGDRDVARAWLETPPLALYYGWLSMLFIPLLAVLFASDAISSELSSGSLRFALVRVDRVSWVLGKLCSQAMLMAIGLAASAASVAAMGVMLLDSFDSVPTIEALFALGLRAWWLGLPYLGLALAASQWVASQSGSRALALLGLIAVGLLPRGIAWSAGDSSLAWASQLFPRAYVLDLWLPNVLDRLPAMLCLLGLTFIYFGLGFLRFARRDL